MNDQDMPREPKGSHPLRAGSADPRHAQGPVSSGPPHPPPPYPQGPANPPYPPPPYPQGAPHPGGSPGYPRPPHVPVAQPGPSWGHASPGAPSFAPWGTAYQPPPPGRSWFARHKTLSALLGFVLLVLVVSAAGSGSKNDTRTPAQAASSEATRGDESATVRTTTDPGPAAQSGVARAGTTVRDGEFEFTVTKVERGLRRTGDGVFDDAAQGEFTVVHVRVKNAGTRTATMDASDQKAYDARGVGYETTTSLGGDFFLDEINPGNEMSGALYFDTPAGTRLVKVRLHDSGTFEGVEVALP